MQSIQETIIEWGPKIILAAVILIIGLIVLKILNGFIKKTINKSSKIDATLKPFLISLSTALLKIVFAISIASTLGLELTSFVAILGAAGLAVGMALSGTLQNFAGGVLILILKPYKVGDYINAQGYDGTVKEIQIFHTILNTPDNKRVIIPNGPMSNGSLINFSAEDTRRIDFVFGIGYDDDIHKAKQLLRDIFEADERVFKDPVPFIRLGEMADSSVNIKVRVWSKASDYWPIYWDMQEKVYDVFNAEGINIPYPQMDVHVHQSA